MGTRVTAVRPLSQLGTAPASSHDHPPCRPPPSRPRHAGRHLVHPPLSGVGGGGAPHTSRQRGAGCDALESLSHNAHHVGGASVLTVTGRSDATPSMASPAGTSSDAPLWPPPYIAGTWHHHHQRQLGIGSGRGAAWLPPPPQRVW